MKVSAYAPACIGNFAAGFDLLGAALAPQDGSLWGDVVTVEEAAETSLTVGGPYAAALPADPGANLVLRTAELVRQALAERGRAAPGLALALDKRLPLASGLGSSSSSIAATLAACQRLLGDPFSLSELFGLAGRGEALVSGSPHLDNVVPALVGGLQLVVPGPEGSSLARSLPWPDDLLLVVVHPGYQLLTETSRRALPACLPLPEAVVFAQNLAAFVHALDAGDRELLRRCLRDPVAEPYRAALVPGFRDAQAAAFAAGAWGCTLSGSGPSLFAVAPSDKVAELCAAGIVAAFARAGLSADAKLCRLDRQGARVLA
jgi:homoserine kinase